MNYSKQIIGVTYGFLPHIDPIQHICYIDKFHSLKISNSLFYPQYIETYGVMQHNFQYMHQIFYCSCSPSYTFARVGSSLGQ